MDIIQSTKELAALVKTLGDMELERRTLALQSEILELTSELVTLRRANSELKERLARKETMHFKAPLYYAEGDNTPFCPKCWEEKQKPIHLIGPEGDSELYRCPSCNFVKQLKPSQQRPDHHRSPFDFDGRDMYKQR